MTKKNFIFFLTVFLSTLSFAQDAQPEVQQEQRKSIVVYFSHKGETFGLSSMTYGCTQLVAIVLAKLTNSDIFEIEPIRQYPTTLRECQNIAKNEKSKRMRIQSKNEIDLSKYETVYFGYPIWWKDMPMISYTFLEKHNLNGKNVIPFVTHSGSGVGISIEKFTSLWPEAKLFKPFQMEGVSVQYDPKNMLQEVMKYLQETVFPEIGL